MKYALKSIETGKLMERNYLRDIFGDPRTIVGIIMLEVSDAENATWVDSIEEIFTIVQENNEYCNNRGSYRWSSAYN